MAQTPPKIVNGKEKKQITAFIVETNTPGFEIAHRCQFMGLRGIGNVLIKFNDVFVPNENLLWGEGLGLKLALITLNTGRLTIPAGCAAGGPQDGRHRQGVGERARAVGRADRQARSGRGEDRLDGVAHVRHGSDRVADLGPRRSRQRRSPPRSGDGEAVQHRSGVADASITSCRSAADADTRPRTSLRERGEKAYPVERIMRDMRINRIFEGTSEIQHLFIAREAVDPHMKRGYKILQPETPTGEKLSAAAKAGAHYAAWYPSRYIGWSRFPKFGEFGKLSGHMGYIERTSRHLSRSIFHAMMRFQAKLERKQMVLFRIVDIGTDLFAMAAAISYATMLAKKGGAEKKNAIDLADVFCREARMRIDANFRNLFTDHDDAAYSLVRTCSRASSTGSKGQVVAAGHADRRSRSKKRWRSWREFKKSPRRGAQGSWPC